MTISEINHLEFAAFIGIDWADQKHDIHLHIVETGKAEPLILPNKPEKISDWVAGLRQRFGGRPVAIALEQKRGALIYALMNYEFLVLFPINPLSLVRFREAFATSRAKDDPVDARLLCDMLRQHRDKLTPWIPDDPLTRRLTLLVEFRRQMVDDRTRLTNRLTSMLKQYFPQALGWAGELSKPLAVDFLKRWPQLEDLQKTPADDILGLYKAHGCRFNGKFPLRHADIMAARPLTTDPAVIGGSMAMMAAQLEPLREVIKSVEKLEAEISVCFAQHPDAEIFLSLPGAGPVFAPRLLAAFGTDRSRFPEAGNLQSYAGVAPVTRRSGKTSLVQVRHACPKFVRQTFHEYACSSYKFSPWARAFYEQQKSRGHKPQEATRALAFKWIRVIHSCWQNREKYDESRYQEQLIRRGSPLAKLIPEFVGQTDVTQS